MKINSFDISQCKARQLNVTMEHNEIKNDSEWVRGSPIPAFLKNTIGFKPCKVVVLVKGKDRDEILENRSNILSRLLEPTTLTLDGFDHKFYGILTKHSITEDSIKRFHRLTLELSGYEIDDEIPSSFSSTTTFTVENPGNIITPAIIEITPQIGISTLTISGLCRDPETGEGQDITIRELSTGKKIVIDGELGFMTEDGANKFKDIDLWELPTLLPGANNITCSTKNIAVTIRFRPRFM